MTNFEALFKPKQIAVVGASASGGSAGNVYIRRLLAYSYGGTIIPVHRTANEIEGLKTQRCLSDIPGGVDYAYIAVPAREVAPVLSEASRSVRFAQVMSSGFAEGGAGLRLDRELRSVVQNSGVRVLGPNSLGTFCPEGGVTFFDGSPRVAGNVGIVSQSGGLAVDIVRKGSARGIDFRAVVSVGNAIDVDIPELLEHYLHDPQTRIVGVYVEGLDRGNRLSALLRNDKRSKPVVILKGGLTQLGASAARSHTGSLAGNGRVWAGVARQFGFALVDTVDDFLSTLAALQVLEPSRRPTKGVALIGNGGGNSVLSADRIQNACFDLPAFSARTRKALEALELPPGTSISNPVDANTRTLAVEDGTIVGKILAIVARDKFDAVIVHLNTLTLLREDRAAETESLMKNILRELSRFNSKMRNRARRVHLLLAMRGDGSWQSVRTCDRFSTLAREGGLAVFEDVPQAIAGLRGIRAHEEFLAARRSPTGSGLL